MPLLLTKDLPRYECLREAAREFPDLDPSATEAFLKLLRAGDEAFRVIAVQLATHEISHGRFGVLMALWRHGRCIGEARALTPADLAEQTGVTRATMTGLIDTLERDGLVRRQPAVEDRRMTTVEATPAGLGTVQRVLPGHFQTMAALMAPLTAAEREVFSGLLDKILKQAAVITAPAAAEAAPH